MTITNEQREWAKVLLRNVYDIMMERTDNYISITTDNHGIFIDAMCGPLDAEKDYAVSTARRWDELDDKWVQDTTDALMRLCPNCVSVDIKLNNVPVCTMQGTFNEKEDCNLSVNTGLDAFDDDWALNIMHVLMDANIEKNQGGKEGET